jgi:hypothetical protein
VSGVRAAVAADALRGPEAARNVIAEHLRSDVGGRCLACRELEPCPQRDTAHAVLFGHDRQLPRRRPLELIGANGDFTTGDVGRFDAFGTRS